MVVIGSEDLKNADIFIQSVALKNCIENLLKFIRIHHFLFIFKEIKKLKGGRMLCEYMSVHHTIS